MRYWQRLIIFHSSAVFNKLAYCKSTNPLLCRNKEMGFCLHVSKLAFSVWCSVCTGFRKILSHEKYSHSAQILHSKPVLKWNCDSESVTAEKGNMKGVFIVKDKKNTVLTRIVSHNHRQVIWCCRGITVSSEMVTALCAIASSRSVYDASLKKQTHIKHAPVFAAQSAALDELPHGYS